MVVPPLLFPLYPDGRYHVSLSFPGLPLSEISKSIEGKSPALLLIPNVEYLIKFIQGDIGIGDSLLKSTFAKNFNSPITKASEGVFKNLAQNTKIDITDINKYKSDGKFTMPLSEIKVSSEFDLGGIKGLEKTLLKSIFETQKPYMEIAKLVISTLAKMEDIVARIMPLALPLGTPLTTQSEKPIGNKTYNALGFNSGAEIKSKMAKLDAISTKGGSVKISVDGVATREGKSGTQSSDQAVAAGDSNFSDGSNQSSTGLTNSNDYTWRVLSKIYSTGDYNPTLDYSYTYINLPPDEEVGDGNDTLDLTDDGDPYKGHKPKCIIFGIYGSAGQPLDPLSPLMGYDNEGNISPTPYKKASWIIESPKWKFPYNYNNDKTGGNGQNYVWPSFGTPTYIWENILHDEKTSKTPPPPMDTGIATFPYDTKKYKANEKNKLNGEVAIPGDPIITGFDAVEETEYSAFFGDLVRYRMAIAEGITQADKDESSNTILSTLKIQSHLENVFMYGQSKSSVYKPLNIPDLVDNPFPSSLKRSNKPYKIYSDTAANDEKLKSYFGASMQDKVGGNTWVDPESDYLAKIIRVDPTTKIEYIAQQGQPPITAEIKSFIKNITYISIFGSQSFNIEVSKSIDPSNSPYNIIDTLTNITSYSLENWNYNDDDGVLATNFGVNQLATNPPVLSNTNAYKITAWGDVNTPYYNTSGYYNWKNTNGDIVQLEKKGDGYWYYNLIDLPPAPIAVGATGATGASGSTTTTTTTTTMAQLIVSVTQSATVIQAAAQYGKSTTGIIRLEADDSIVEVVDNKITKWFYMTPSTIGNINGYGNGELKNTDIPVQYLNTNGTLNSLSSGVYSNPPLPKNGNYRYIRIGLYDVNNQPGYQNSGLSYPGNGSKSPFQSFLDEPFNSFQVKVKSEQFPNGQIIDPSKILNDQLKTSEPFVNIPGTKYGHGSIESPQEIGIIKRFMLTEFDTESYYIIEGVLPEVADTLLGATAGTGGANGNGTGGGSGGGGYYKLPDAIGAIKVFVSVLVDIFSKLIPAIKKLLALIKDPLSFITDIVSEKLGEGFPFLSKEAFDTFKNAAKIAGSGGASALAGMASGVGTAVGAAAGSVGDVAGAATGVGDIPPPPKALPDSKKSDKIKKLENYFKDSKLGNVVFVDKYTAKYKCVLDGRGTIPFEMFSKDLSFGIELKMGDLPKKPLKLIFPSNTTLSKIRDNGLGGNAGADSSQNPGTVMLNNLQTPKNPIGTAGSQNTLPDGTKLNPNDTYKIISIKYSTGEFINGVNYNYIYVNQDVELLIKQADDLVENGGTQEDLAKAKEKLEAAKALDPTNKLIDTKLKDIKEKDNYFESTTQPLIKFILGLVTLPIKIVAKIIQYIMDFFKALTNPLTLPSKLVEFLSFKWILDFFIPPGPPLPGLLKAIGIKFDPTKLVEWVTLANIPNPAKTGGVIQAPQGFQIPEFIYKQPLPKGDHLLPDDFELADLNEFISIPFNMKLPTYTARQIRTSPKNPLYIFWPTLCLLEKIINAIIDLFWSILGIEAIIPPPHIKICKALDDATLSPEDIAKLLNGETPKGASQSGGAGGTQSGGGGTTPADSVTPGTEAFIYEITLPDGTVVKDLNREEMQKYVDDHKDIGYDFQF